MRSLTSKNIDRHTSMHVATLTHSAYLYTHAWPEHPLNRSTVYSIQYIAQRINFLTEQFCSIREHVKSFSSFFGKYEMRQSPFAYKNTFKGIKMFMKVNFASPWHVLGDSYSKKIQNIIKDGLRSSFIDKYWDSWCSGYMADSRFKLYFDSDWPE